MAGFDPKKAGLNRGQGERGGVAESFGIHGITADFLATCQDGGPADNTSALLKGFTAWIEGGTSGHKGTVCAIAHNGWQFDRKILQRLRSEDPGPSKSTGNPPP